MFLTKDRFTPAHAIKEKSKKIKNILGSLTGDSNSKILYFIDVINKLINDENYRIDGYRNRRDQNEIAVVDLSSVIDDRSIVRGKFEKVVIANPGVIPNVVTFPFTPRRIIDVTGFQSGTWDSRQSKAICPYDAISPLTGIIIKEKALYTLYYKWENEASTKIFRCLANVRDDAPQFVNDV
jgi:hypothetical protein